MAWLYWHVNDRNISVLERRVWKPVDDVLLGRLSLLKWMWIKDGVFRRELSSFSEVTMNSRLNEILSECSRIIMSHDESSCVIMRHHKSSEVTMLTPRESRCNISSISIDLRHGSNFGTNLWTSAPNVNLGSKFNWNVNFGTLLNDNVCQN